MYSLLEMKSASSISSVFPLVDAASNPGAKFLVPDLGNIVENPMPLSTISPSQELRVWPRQADKIS